MTQRRFAIPIFMYHEVTVPEKIKALSQKMQYSFIMERDQFETQMQLLSDLGFQSCSFHELRRWLAEGSADDLPPKPVIITFDDGYAGNFHYALPILQKYRFTATFFIITARISQPVMMTWTQLSTLSEAGMTVQSHTVTHALLGSLKREQIRRELQDSKHLIEDRLGRPVEFISLPYGSYNHHYNSAAIEAGYKGGCTSKFGYVDRNADPFLLNRIAVKSTTGLADFRKIAEQDNWLIKKTITARKIKSGVKTLLGERTYNNLYNRIYGVTEESPK
jgi:peptidoglycan/xylan/chitin deacetylase (PgdA/CDA1 family)